MKVELRNVTKAFPSRNKKSGEEVIAVNDCSFTIPEREADRPARSFRLRQKHHTLYDMRPAKAHKGADILRRG